MSLAQRLRAWLGGRTRRRDEPVVASDPVPAEADESGTGDSSDSGEAEDDEEGEPFPEPVEIPITDSIDLHYFPPKDVGEIVDAYLEAAAERGFREVRIIHGRGRGVQRNRVRIHLERSPYVEAFDDAPGDRGGWGATLAILRVD